MNNHPMTLEKIAALSSTRLLTDDLCNDMRAAYDLGRAEQLEQVEDAWCDALQEETECGVKFLSENRAADMKRDYPVLTSFGVVLDAMRPTQEEN